MGHLAFHAPLTSLSLDNIVELTDQTLKYIVDSRTTLTQISIANCQKLTSNSIIRLANKLNSRLTYLNMSYNFIIEDTALIELCRNCHSLQYLNISGLNKISNVQTFSDLKKLSNLKTLKMNQCTKFNSDAIRNWNIFPFLTTFSLENINNAINDDYLISIIPNIEELNISNSGKLTLQVNIIKLLKFKFKFLN